MPPPYRPTATPVLNPAPSPAKGGATGFGAAIIRQGDLRLSSGKNFKMQNFVRVLSNSAPVLSGLTDQFPFFILYFSICILQFSLPVPSSPFAPGGYLSILFFLHTAKARRRRLRRGLPTDYYSPDISGEISLCQALIPPPWRCSLTAVSLDRLSMEGL